MDYLKVNAFEPAVFQQMVPQFADIHGEGAALQLSPIAGMNPADGVNSEGQSHYGRPPWGGTKPD
jgi:hypothetical protein